jgi:chlorobactene glucosyltransferase
LPFIFYFILPCLSIFLIIATINAVGGPFLRKRHELKEKLLVSVLIPARDEEHNISTCLQSLLEQDYAPLEIRILDDESKDNTASIVRKFEEENTHIHLHSGISLPQGWTGKNWACHQLSKQAKGDIYIFTDADNRFEPQAISRTVAWMQHYQLGMFSVFPQQITVSFFEKLIIPVIDLLLYSSLVLWLTYRSRFSSLAAANGQWIAFQCKIYHDLDGHQAVQQQIVEDVELSRLAKRKGIKILTGAGTGIVYGHMYHSTREVWEGFSKNLFGLVSNKSIPFFLILISLFMIYILPYFLAFNPDFLVPSAIAISLNVVLRLVLAVRFRHPVLLSTIFHPISMIITILIGLNSFRKVKWGKIHWKGRNINPNLQ